MYGCTQNRELAFFFAGLDPIEKIRFTASAVFADRDSAMYVLRIHLQLPQSIAMSPFSGDGVLWLCLGRAVPLVNSVSDSNS